EPISLDRQDQYLKYFSQFPQKASDYSFVNLWGWATVYGLYWAWADQMVWIKQTIPKEVFWAPVAPWPDIDWNLCFDKYFDSTAVFHRVPEDLMVLWKEKIGNRIVIEESREHWDYLYDVNELTQLSGRRYHKKKNLLNQFKKNYDFQFVPFDLEMIDMAMALQEDWCTWHDCKSLDALAAENLAISRVLGSWEKLTGPTGGAILVDRQMIAYTIAEPLSEDTLVIHFEKGNVDFKGIYQAVNQMCLEYLGQNFKIVNREQDLGDEGLRKSKLSYNPLDFLKKYRINLK
ncbi:MAG: phosphatidylglycerol lysyltransferase domain-containing protein, partial [Desulfobacterales bacterium]